MKSLQEMYAMRFEDIKRHSLAGLYALMGNLGMAARIASREGDVLHVQEILRGISEIGKHDEFSAVTKRILQSPDITDDIKSVCCLAASLYGDLESVTDFIVSKPDLWDMIIDNYATNEYEEVVSFAIAVKNVDVAKRTIDYLVDLDFLFPLHIEKIFSAYVNSKIELTPKQKQRIMRAAVSGNQRPEEVEASERLAGRKLTRYEHSRYLHNRFRVSISLDMESPLDWVWGYQSRKLSKHERSLLRKDALETLGIRS